MAKHENVTCSVSVLSELVALSTPSLPFPAAAAPSPDSPPSSLPASPLQSWSEARSPANLEDEESVYQLHSSDADADLDLGRAGLKKCSVFFETILYPLLYAYLRGTGPY